MDSKWTGSQLQQNSQNEIIDEASDSGTEILSPVLGTPDMSPFIVNESPLSEFASQRQPLGTGRQAQLNNPLTKRCLFNYPSQVNLSEQIECDWPSPSNKECDSQDERIKYKDYEVTDEEQVPESICFGSSNVETQTSRITQSEEIIDESPRTKLPSRKLAPADIIEEYPSSCGENQDSEREVSLSDDDDCISSTSCTSRSPTDQVRGTQWIRSLVTPSKETSQSVVHQPPLGSARKSRFIKDGFAKQLENVLLESRADRAFREQNPSPGSKSLVVRVTKMLTQDAGHLLFDCVEVDPPVETDALPSTSSGSSVTLNLPPGDTLGVMLPFKVAQRLTLWVGSQLYLKPPWQMLHVTSSAKSFILCPTVINVDLPPDCPVSVDNLQEYRWACPCVEDPTISSNSCSAKDRKSHPDCKHLQRVQSDALLEVHADGGAALEHD